MNYSIKIIFSTIWLLITGLGFWYCSSSFVEASLIIRRNLEGPIHPAIFLSGPVICGSIAYLLSPALFARRNEPSFALTLNFALGVPLAAIIVIALLYFVIYLIIGGLGPAFTASFSVTAAIAGISGAIFGSGIVASIASRLYLRKARSEHDMSKPSSVD